ncbi:hypothetical protein BDR03DRAFT_1014708 [Suillus americanus]|nr:hypothetical protein BDR03DRAFT_1014708 [Suillus americanus]
MENDKQQPPGGLHPSYITFNSYSSSDEQSIMQEYFLRAALQDMFDMITMQDCLDGGISILMRCAGSEASEALSPEHFTIDLYITPWEYHETPEHIGGDLSAFVQAFSEEFVIPHLQHFSESCCIEGIVPPQHYPTSQVNLSGPPFLPGPLAATGAQIQCSAHPTKQFECDFEVSNKLLSAAIQMGQAVSKALPGKSKSDIQQHHNADTFLLNSTEPGTATISKPLGTKNMLKFTGTVASFQAGTPLISIGPHTDAIGPGVPRTRVTHQEPVGSFLSLVSR